MWEIIENLPGWAKLTGVSIPVLLVILVILYFNGGSEVVEIPSTLEEIKENVTTQTMEETTGAAVEIISEFNDAGKEMAKDVEDPIAKGAIIFGMNLAGLMLALFIILTVYGAIQSAFNK